MLTVEQFLEPQRSCKECGAKLAPNEMSCNACGDKVACACLRSDVY